MESYIGETARDPGRGPAGAGVPGGDAALRPAARRGVLLGSLIAALAAGLLAAFWRYRGVPGLVESAAGIALGGGIALLAAWVLLAFVFPVGSGWVHLLMGAGVILLIRRVVTGPRAW